MPQVSGFYDLAANADVEIQLVPSANTPVAFDGARP